MTPGTASCIQLWYSPEAPHTSQNLQKQAAKNLQTTAKNREEVPLRTIQINDGTDTPSTIHPPQVATRLTTRRAPKCGGGGVYAAWPLQSASGPKAPRACLRIEE